MSRCQEFNLIFGLICFLAGNEKDRPRTSKGQVFLKILLHLSPPPKKILFYHDDTTSSLYEMNSLSDRIAILKIHVDWRPDA